MSKREKTAEFPNHLYIITFLISNKKNRTNNNNLLIHSFGRRRIKTKQKKLNRKYGFKIILFIHFCLFCGAAISGDDITFKLHEQRFFLLLLLFLDDCYLFYFGTSADAYKSCHLLQFSCVSAWRVRISTSIASRFCNSEKKRNK